MSEQAGKTGIVKPNGEQWRPPTAPVRNVCPQCESKNIKQGFGHRICCSCGHEMED